MRARSLVCLLLLASLAAAAPAAAASPRITFYFGLERPEAAARAAFFAVSDPASPTYRRFASAARWAPVRRERRDPAGLPPRRGAPRTARAGRRVRRVRPRDRAGAPARARLRRDASAPVHQRPNAHFWLIPRNGAPHLPADMAPHRARGRRLLRAARPRGAPATAAAAAAREPRQRGHAGPAAARRRAATRRLRASRRSATPTGSTRVGTGAGGSVALLNVGEGVPRQRPRRVRALLRAAAARDPRAARPTARRSRSGAARSSRRRISRSSAAWRPGSARSRSRRSGSSPSCGSSAPRAGLRAPPRLPDTLSMSYGECEQDIRGRALRALLARGRAADGRGARAARPRRRRHVRLGRRLRLDLQRPAATRGSRGPRRRRSSPPSAAAGSWSTARTRAPTRSSGTTCAGSRPRNGGGAGGGGFGVRRRGRPTRRGLRPARRPPRGARRRRARVDAPRLAGRTSTANWITDAGTSASSPLVAAAFAVIGARQRAAGLPPLGPVNGLLYASAPATRYDITSGRQRLHPQGPGARRAAGLRPGERARRAGVRPARVRDPAARPLSRRDRSLVAHRPFV